jgi:hypothetical protein
MQSNVSVSANLMEEAVENAKQPIDRVLSTGGY